MRGKSRVKRAPYKEPLIRRSFGLRSVRFQLISMKDGIYLIENSLIQFSCELDFMTSVTDHTLFAANITKVNSNDSSPLVWHKSNFYDL